MTRLKLLALLGTCLVVGPVWDASGQTLQTDPPDAHLRIEGPLTVAGRVPISLRALPVGEYRLVGRAPGMAASRGRFEIDGRGLTVLSWSGPDALLKPPGLAHLEMNEPRGWYHLGVSAVSGAFWGLGIQDVGDAEDRIERWQEESRIAADPTAQAQAGIELATARTEKIDEERVRDLWGTFFLASWVGAGIEAWLLTPETSIVTTSSGARVVLPRANRWGAAARSILAPGAGQRYLGRDTRANVFSTLVAASVAGAILAQDSYLEARRDEQALERQLDLAETDAQRLRFESQLEEATSDKDTKSLIRWVFTGSAAYFYLWNVVDALWLGRRAEMSRPGPSVSLAPTSEGMALQLSWRFH